MSSPWRLLHLPEELLVIILDDLDQHAIRNARLCCRQIDNLLLDAFSKQIPKHIRCCFVKPIQLQSLKALVTRKEILTSISTVTLASLDPNDFIDPRRGNGYLTSIIESLKKGIKYESADPILLLEILGSIGRLAPHISISLEESLFPSGLKIPPGERRPHILPILATGHPVGLADISLRGYDSFLKDEDLATVIHNSQRTLTRCLLDRLSTHRTGGMTAALIALKSCERLETLELSGLSEQGTPVLFASAVASAGGRSSFARINGSRAAVGTFLDLNLRDRLSHHP